MNNINQFLKDNWNEVIEYIGAISKNQLQYTTFITSVKFHNYKNGVMNLIINMSNPSLNSETTKNYINVNCNDLFKTAISATAGIGIDEFDINYFLPDESLPEDDAAYSNNEDTLSNNNLFSNNLNQTSIKNDNNTITNNNINPKYTFDNYISGEENRIVYTACLRVAENPGDKNINPLFIYGKAGLGKTHLMHAIANKIIHDDRTKNVLYVTSEKLTNDIIDAIRKNNKDANSTKVLRNTYRTVDVLLVDDIQYIIGKETVQNEFFNTFNELYEQGSQIVLTCDKKPKDLEVLEERMKSRFLSGLPVDVNMPTYETRMAILKQKVEDENLDLSINEDILRYIASNVSSNIRELEGAMNKIILLSRSANTPLSLEEVKNEISDMITSNTANNIKIETILQVVSELYGVSIEDIKSNTRTSEVIEPRHMCMYISHKFTHHTLKAIGEKMGGKDHTTIMNAEKNVKKKLSDPSKYEEFNEKYKEAKKKLGINELTY